MRWAACILLALALATAGCIGGSDSSAPTAPTASPNQTADGSNASTEDTNASSNSAKETDSGPPEGYRWENLSSTSSPIGPWPAENFVDVDVPNGTLNFTLAAATNQTARISVEAPSEGPQTPCAGPDQDACEDADALADYATHPTHCCAAQFTVENENETWGTEEPEAGTWTLRVERPVQAMGPSVMDVQITTALLVPANTTQ